MRSAPIRVTVLLVALGSMAIQGCADLGDDPASPRPVQLEGPRLADLVPRRTVVGDTVRVIGEGFGATAGEFEIVFRTGGPDAAIADIVAWSDTEVGVRVPGGAVDGEVAVRRVGGAEPLSPGIPFAVAPRLVSFRDDLRAAGAPFQRQGCNSCHFDRNGGESNFSVARPSDIRIGGLHGPAALPRRSQESLIIMAMRGTAKDVPRMPFGGNPMPEDQIRLIADWIDQGMRDN